MVDDSERSEQFGQFEKNRFFDGKLMTARDMKAEQRYHADRLETLTRHLSGSGILTGLEIRSVRTVESRLEVTLDAGIAVDSVGRPIVVETPTTRSIPEPDGKQCHLFVRFDEAETGEVPVPDADSRHSETQAGRIVESFEVTSRQSPPDRPSLSVELSAHLDPDATTGEVADRIAAAFDQGRTSQPSDPAVYLGGFERTADDNWTAIDSPEPSYVYTNELVYATLIEYITHTAYLPQTDLTTEPSGPTDDEFETVSERVEQLHGEISALKARQDQTTTQLLSKTLRSAGRLFATTADQFVEQHPEVSKAAREISTQIGAMSHSTVAGDPEEFSSVVDQLEASLVAFGEQLDGAARTKTVDRYTDALAKLQSRVAAEAPVVEIATAFDDVAEAAVDLDVVHQAYPEQ